MTVETALEGPRAHRVSVIGILEAGSISRLGIPVTIVVDGREPLTARLIGGPSFDVRPPFTGILLEGVAGADVPRGALITSVAE